ncbi:MAG TPA: choice-of-anchor D domain-containing protein [Acidobacteriaceae bacterium]|jgi:hypothetical protein|nr:choice-of-anchor D domain-containing protein [Acidobacteriaceae bacterium]
MKAILTLATGCAFAFATVLPLRAQAPNNLPAAGKQAAKNFRNLPLAFEANQGQADPAVRFLARGAGYGIYLTEREAVLTMRPSLRRHSPSEGALRADRTPPEVVRMKLAGASTAAQPDGLNKLPGVANYFIGNDPSKWRTGVPTYAKVRYAGVYPGVDLVYYGDQQHLEYDFVVEPGKSASAVRLSFEGAKSVKLDADGNLVLKSKRGEMVFQQPIAYQVEGGVRREVESRFRLFGGKSAGFRLGSYDHAAPLIIDPVLVYATLLGGNGLGGDREGDAANAVATDAQGNAYVTGFTDSSDFPVSSPYDGTYNSEFEMAFVSKINADGSAFVYSTFLGGTWDDVGQSIAADTSGNAYIAGGTRSSDFPLVNPIQNGSFINQFGQWHGFVTKIAPSGESLVYSTYLGGTGEDYAFAIAVDPSRNVYIAGYTSSQDFPTVNPLQAKNKATTTNPLTGFVSKINPGGTAFVYSTYLGGSYSDVVYGIAADKAGNAYATGQALSSNFPVYNALQSKFVGTAGYSAAPFLSKIKGDGSSFVYSTYVGGGGEAPTGAGDAAYAVAADSIGDAYIVGEVYSTLDLPLVHALQTTLGPLGYGAFLTKVNPEGSAFDYSTFIGDTNGADGVATDRYGNAYVTGYQYCPWDLPAPVNPVATCVAKGPSGNGSVILEAFIYRVAADGSAITFASPYGGGYEQGYGIAVDPSGNVYVAGQVDRASAFPTVNALENHAEGTAEGFLLKIDMAVPTATLTPGTLSFASTTVGNTTAAEVATLKNTSASLTLTIDTNGISFTGADPGSFTRTATTCGTTLAAGDSCTISVALKPTHAGSLTAELSVADNATGSPQLVSLSGTGVAATVPTATLTPGTLSFASTTVGNTTAAEVATLKNTSASLTLTINTNGISFTGADPGSFTRTATTCGTILAARASCTISVALKPTHAGSLTAELSVADNATGSPQLVSLSGTGVAATVPTATLAPGTLSFASTAVGNTTTAQIATLKNTSASLTLTISTNGISFTGADPGSFTRTATTCGTTLAAGASCTISVALKPTHTGLLTAELSVADNATGSPQLVSLSGTGVAAPNATRTP